MNNTNSVPLELLSVSPSDISRISTNHTYNTTENDLQIIRSLYILKAYVQPAIFIAGILGNGLTFAVLQRMWMSPLCNILITSLCVTDFFCCTFGLENSVLETIYFAGRLPRGLWSSSHLFILCMYYMYILLLCMSCATVVLISIIRNYSLRHPLRTLHVLTPSRVRKCVLAVDTGVLVLFLPVAIHVLWQVCYKDVNHVQICFNISSYVTHAKSLQYYLLFLVVLFGPVAAILNLIYWLKLKQAIKLSAQISSHMQQQLSDAKKRDQTRRTMRVTLMFLYILIFNALCVLPFSIDKMIETSHVGELYWESGAMNSGIAVFNVVVHLIVAILPTINLWVYLVVNQYFRKEFTEMVFCKTYNEVAMSRDSTFCSKM